MEVSAANGGQQTLHAGVLSFPVEDLFVAFQGMNADGTCSINVKVNPLIMLNWTAPASRSPVSSSLSRRAARPRCSPQTSAPRAPTR